MINASEGHAENEKKELNKMKKERRKKIVVYMAILGCMTVFLTACGSSTRSSYNSSTNASKYEQTNTQSTENMQGGSDAAHNNKDITADDLSGNTDLVKEILLFSNDGFLLDRTEYIYTADELVERKREYFATENSNEPETMSLLQETVYTYDEKGRVSSEQIFDAEGNLVLTGTYSYDEEYNLLKNAAFVNDGGTTMLRYEFGYQMVGLPIISGEYIWNDFRNIYFNGNIKNVHFHFGLDGEIVECLAYSGDDFTGIPDCDIEYTCDDDGAITSVIYNDIMNGWGSYRCDYERSSKGIETISYYYLSGDSMRKEFYNYDEKDRLESIEIVDEEMDETYSIKYNYYE